jgi:hypothetical protein
MRKQTKHNTVEEIARMHLGVGDLTVPDVRNLSVLSIRVALTEALKAGERLGYNKGYQDAKDGCGNPVCDCEHSL